MAFETPSVVCHWIWNEIQTSCRVWLAWAGPSTPTWNRHPTTFVPSSSHAGFLTSWKHPNSFTLSFVVCSLGQFLPHWAWLGSTHPLGPRWIIFSSESPSLASFVQLSPSIPLHTPQNHFLSDLSVLCLLATPWFIIPLCCFFFGLLLLSFSFHA